MNIWSKFKRLTGKKEVRVGTITAHSGNESILEDPYGNAFIALGTSVSVGSKAFVEDGKVVSAAPSLPETTEYV
jgi:hypothetical protein